MTDQSQVPPPPPPPPPPAVTPPDQVAPATYATPPPPPPPVEPAASGTGGGHRKAIVGGLVAAIVLGGGYGAYAVYDKLDGGGPQPHDVLPASTELYLRLDLDPSASQKIDLFRLIRKVPDLADEAGITSDKQDLRELVFKDALTDECDDVDYDRDVAPWLGDRIGIGANIEDKSFILAVQTTDEGKSRAGIKKLFACDDEKYGIAFLDGYAILAPKQADVDAAVKATAKASLGDDKDFTADFDELGNQGIASGWADLKAISKLPEVTDALGDEATEIAKAGSVATALRADGDAIELAVLGGPGSKGKSQATSLAKLPADTVAALSVAGVGDQITDQFDSFVEQFDKEFAGGSDGTSFGAADGSTADPISVTTTPDVPTVSPPTFDPDDFGLEDDDFGGGDDFSGGGSSDGFGFGIGSAQDLIDDLDRETGLRLPDDLATLFGDSLTLAVGADNLETIPTLSGPEGLNALNIALSLTSDRADALDLVKRLATLASDNGISLVAAPTDDGAVLATNQDAADSIAKPDGKLGDQKAFASVIPDGDSTSGGFYLDIGTILDKLLAADPPDDVRQDIESAKALSAFGVSTGTSGDRSLFRVRLAFD